MIKKALFFLLIVLLYAGCSRDDICAESTPTTPKLIIVFNDILNPTARKAVNQLQVVTADELETSVPLASSDSIAIPLRTGMNVTRYQFIMNAGTEEEVIDTYIFSYERNNVYVNRACSFKTNYEELTLADDDTDEDWILNTQTNNQTVADETQAHLTFFH